MENGKHLVYEFRGFQLDTAQQKLLCQGQPVALSPKLFETLVFLVQNRDRTLLKDELMQALWAGTFVEEANLSQNIFLLRKALGDDRNGHSFIHTVPRRGYRFVAPVTEIETESALSLPGARDWEYWKKHSPFRSLTVFEEEDAWLFFGREVEAAELVSRVQHSSVVAVVGNSGSGKSSLLRAGLIPALRAGFPVPGNGANGAHGQECWRIAVFRPSAAPFDYLAEVLPGQLAPELSATEQADFIADCRAKLPAGDALRDAVAALVSAARNKSGDHGPTQVLLVADQFEELFTLTAKPAIRDRYIDALLAAAHCSGAVSVHLVLSLRADFFGHCLDHPTLRRCLETSFNLGSMTPEQMRETIEKRLHLAGGRAEPGLIDSLLEDVGAEPGNLALLEHALGQLWEQCGGPGCTFTNIAYAQMGRLRGALGRHADAVFQSLDNEQKPLAKGIFFELVHLGDGAQDTRRRVSKTHLLSMGQQERIEQLLARLASSRLIATGREGEETFVEVSHEALIREWLVLRQWLEENREELALERRLAQAAEEWQSLNRDPGVLLQSARLPQAEEWLARHVGAAGLVRAYIEASNEARNQAIRQEHEAQQRELRRQRMTARRFRWFSYALTVLMLVATGSAWFAYHLRVLEKSRAIAARAEELGPRDPGQALDLAIHGWEAAKTEEGQHAVAMVFPEPLLTLKHDDSVDVAVFSSDGQRILSTSHDHTARLWSARDGQLIAILRQDREIHTGAFSPDGRLIATASEDRTARVWDGLNGRLLATLKGHADAIWQVRFSPDGKRVITASSDHTARVWDSANGQLLMTLQGHSDPVVIAKFSPDGRYIATAGVERAVRLWNAANGQLLAILRGHSDSVNDLEFSPDGRRLATASYDRTARIWNTEDGRSIAVLHHEAPVWVAMFSPDGQTVSTAGHDYVAHVWNSNDGKLLATLRHYGPVRDLAYSPDGRWIVTASNDHTARVWTVATGRLLAILHGHSDELNQAAFSPSGQQIVTASDDHTVRTWSLGGARSTVLNLTSLVQSAMFSPDGKTFVTAGDDRTARLWSAADGRLLIELKGHTDRIWGAAFSYDGLRIVTASADGTARVWRTADGALLAVLRGHEDQVVGATFSPDGQRIVTASWDRTARLWNAATGQLQNTLLGHSDRLWTARFSRDGQHVVSASSDNTARIWNVADGRLLHTLEGHTAHVNCAVFSPDSRLVVTASWDHTARVWNVADGRLLATLRGHTAEVNAAVFSRDNQRILTSSKDNTARLWDRDGQLLNTYSGHSSIVWAAFFSPDERRIVTGSADSTARLWDTSDGRLLTTLRGHSYWIVHADFSSSGDRIITASYDNTVRLWQLLTLDDIERILSK